MLKALKYHEEEKNRRSFLFLINRTLYSTEMDKTKLENEWSSLLGLYDTI